MSLIKEEAERGVYSPNQFNVFKVFCCTDARKITTTFGTTEYHQPTYVATNMGTHIKSNVIVPATVLKCVKCEYIHVISQDDDVPSVCGKCGHSAPIPCKRCGFYKRVD